MRLYRCTITGNQPLIHHADSIEWSDEMDKWKANKDNKGNSKAGDDRSPAWRWLGSLYHDGEVIVMPAENLMVSIRQGGAMVPTGKGKKTFKAQTQSGIIPGAATWPLIVDGAEIPVAEILKLNGEHDFDKHKQVAIDHGFTLYLKRAKIGQAKHVRVRPRFRVGWQVVFELNVKDDQITTTVLEDVIGMAGEFCGICDWRPGSKTPGIFGTFDGAVEYLGEH